MNPVRCIYLHGFASGPGSRKAQAFADALRPAGIQLEIPALEQGDFEHLTISSQLGVIERLLNNEPAHLIGSSLGGYLAAVYASQHPEVDRLVLLAPAFRFAARWRQINGPEKIREWQETGWLEVFHYGTRTPRRLHRNFMADADRYPGEPDFHQAARIFHGVADTTVPVELSRAFIAARPNAELIELDSDHELLNVLQAITAASVPFLTMKGSELA